mmetsp:Transcript_39899/g.77946  ORF Transcript_39899/g.77946 Transcript_39899/m.77946 type:complete len:213 (-) Transcript_39899:28-666(-)
MPCRRQLRAREVRAAVTSSEYVCPIHSQRTLETCSSCSRQWYHTMASSEISGPPPGFVRMRSAVRCRKSPTSPPNRRHSQGTSPGARQGRKYELPKNVRRRRWPSHRELRQDDAVLARHRPSARRRPPAGTRDIPPRRRGTPVPERGGRSADTCRGNPIPRRPRARIRPAVPARPCSSHARASLRQIARVGTHTCQQQNRSGARRRHPRRPL